MTPVGWSAILALVGGAVDIAIRIVEAIRGCGGDVTGCPAEVEATLDTRPLPTGEAGISALHRLRMRGAGFVSQDADELHRSARAEKLAEGVVVIRRRPA